MRTENTPSRLPLLLAALALVTAIATALVLWLWLPTTSADQPEAETAQAPTPSSAPSSPAASADPHSDTTAPPGGSAAANKEAVDAVTAAFTDYLAANDAITAAGGESSSQIAEYVTAEYLPTAMQGYSGLSGGTSYSVGESAFDSVSLIKNVPHEDGTASVSIGLCLDSSGLAFVDSSGVQTSYVSAGNARLDVRVDFLVAADPAQRPLISGSQFTGLDYLCQA